MADRLDFEIDVELERGLTAPNAGLPGLIAAGMDGGATHAIAA